MSEDSQPEVGPLMREPQFWQNLQVYHDAIVHKETRNAYRSKVSSKLVKLGLGNLSYICDRFGVEYKAKEELPQALAWRLMESDAAILLIHLSVFLRQRAQSLIEYFENQVSIQDAMRMHSDILSKSRSHQESTKPLTKLLWIYLRNPDELEAIHYRFAWRVMPSLFEYEFESGIPKGGTEKLTDGIPQLIKDLDKRISGETFSFFGSNQLQPGLDVFVVHRNYPTSVKPDYLNRYRLQHDFGRIVFGLYADRSALIVKVANRAIAATISRWVSGTLSAKLIRAGGEIYSSYESKTVEKNFLGGYDPKLGVELTEIVFRHTTMPGNSPLVVRANDYNRSIREDLKWLAAQRAVRLTTLADIESFTVRFDGTETKVGCVMEKGGAATLKINDSHLDEQHIEGLRTAFLESFGIPLSQRIDPTVMEMGAAETYQFLMSGVDDTKVLGYQREYLGRLINWGLLKTIEGKTGRCKNPNCGGGSQQVHDESAKECPDCQGALTWEDFKRYEDDPKGTIAFVRTLLRKETGWRFSSSPRRFASYDFYKLSSKSNPNKMVCVFVNDRLSTTKLETFQGAMFPILVVHPTGTQRTPVVDTAGIGHVGFPYALAANESIPAKKEFREGCKKVISRLLQTEHERVLRASRHSRDSIDAKAADYNDRVFEADVYNLLRRFFPYSIKWGGQNRPDGFCSLIYFEGNDLADARKFNVSYDAKYSDTTYPFGIGEYRQMFDYIHSLYRSRRLQTEGNRYNGHMIISNEIKESAMENASEYLWTQHRLGKDHTDFLLIFMVDSFLVRLWDLVHDAGTEFAQRWLFFPETVISTIKSFQSGGFSLLDAAAADEIVSHVLRQPAVENPINHEFLQEDLSYIQSLKARDLKGRPRSA